VAPVSASPRALLLAAILLAAAVPGSARAAPLGFTGTLTLQLIPGSIATVVVPASGVAQVTGSPHLASFLLPGGVFGPVTTLIDLGNASGTDLSLAGFQNLGGSFTAGGGPMGFHGIARLCLLFAPCDFANVPLPVAATGTPAAGFGIGGTQMIMGAIDMTAQHAPWAASPPGMTIHTPATVVSTLTFPAGFIHGPASGSASTAAQPGGVVQLVTASKVYTSLTGAYPELPMYAVLNLHFVPEPGTLGLALAAAVGLLAAGRGRR